MRKRPPIIKTASDTPGPTRFNVGRDCLSAEEIVRIKTYMWKNFHIDWKAPREIIEVESHREIEHIMQERPVDRRGENW